MKPIQNPPPPDIGPNSDSDAVANLQEALLFLFERERLHLSVNERDDLLRDRDERVYHGSTGRAVIVFREQFGLEPGELVDEPTAKELNKLLRELGAFDTPPAEWVVRGKVVDAYGHGLAEYKVSLLEYDLNRITLIDSAPSNSDGTFEFAIRSSEALREGDSATALDLVFQISDQIGLEQPVTSIVMIGDTTETTVPRLAESEQAPTVLINVSTDLLLRVVVTLDYRPPTEFELLVARLNPFMQQVDFADLKEDGENFQISFLNKETGIEKSKIEQLRDAFQLERETVGVPAWVFFGLAAQGLGLASVVSMPFDKLVSCLKPLQPASDRSDLEAIANQLRQFLIERNIQTQIGTLKASAGEILHPVLESEEKLHVLLDAYIRHEGDTESFWEKMGENPDFQAEIPAIQFNLQLSQLTLNNVGLAKALQQTGIANTRQLVDVSSETWEALAFEHKAGIPAHIIGEDDQARAKIYAHELQMLVELAFPTAVIKKSIQNPDTSSFLDNNPDFEFTHTPVESYLFERGQQAFDGIQRPDEVKAQLRQMQRLYTLTASAADMNTLMELNFTSAHQIARLSLEAFTREIDGRISPENIQNYHAKAVSVSETSAVVYHLLRDLALVPAPSTVQNSSGDPNALRSIPDWETLFGSLELCECEHCKSVYSPAAYFVDLLHILLGQNKGAARQEIFRRRPDLLYTKLSCEHTETLIPYIDLVNEVLETYVAQSHVGDIDAKGHAEISTNDTSNFTASDLAANPQHPNPNAANDAASAYALLAGAKFPLNLPFDMNLETARQFLKEQNSSRFDVMKTFGDAKSNAARAERLRVSKPEFEVLTLKQLDGATDAGIDPVKDLWGSPSIPAGQTLGEVLVKVDTFLEHTGIVYTDLISLLATRFLNPNFPINVFLQELSDVDRSDWLATHPDEDQFAQSVIELGADVSDPCNLRKTQIRRLNGEFLSDGEFSRFNRFIRLWKKLGCTIPELDALLTALKATDITPEIIQDLSIIWQVQPPLRLTFDVMAVLVGDIPTTGKDSLFARLFLNKAILQIDPVFALNVAQTELENTADRLENHIPAILAAYRISEEELYSIAAYTHLDLANAALNLANLSQLYRYVIFAKGLRMKIKALITWLKLFSPLLWPASADMLEIQAWLARLQRHGFKAADFAYIFQDERASGYTLPPTEEIITQSARMLRGWTA